MAVYKINRRNFIGQASCLAVGGTSLMSSLLNMKTIDAMTRNASSFAACNDYKALVCIFNSGGLDSFNMLVPRSTSEYNVYNSVRSNNALPLNQLLSIDTLNTPGRLFGLHPSMINMRNLFNTNKLAFISNIGSLVFPMTKQEFYDETVVAPLGLFSHSDQQMHWQTGFSHARAATGWAGKISDLLISCNSNQNLSVSMSLSGSNLLQTGPNSVEFSLNPWSDTGTVDIGSDASGSTWDYDVLRRNSLTNMLDATYNSIFETTYKNSLKNARDTNALVKTALQNAPNFNTAGFEDNYFANSLKLVAKIIASQSALGMNRQVFFIDYGGWDHHDELLNNQSAMLEEVDQAFGAFVNALNSINRFNDVTTFSLSEFSRTLTSNGNGTDHAWGANVFAFGGDVIGKKIYGEYPLLNLNGPLEVGGGVFIPTTAAEEYFAELALWFGVSPSSLVDLFPNLPNFYSVSGTPPIGFMNI